MQTQQLILPCKEQELENLTAGDRVCLTGVIYTARDAAHKRLYDLIMKNQPLPIDTTNLAIYYAGPCPPKPCLLYTSITGGNRLLGQVEVSGAKNAAVAIIPTAILCEGVCTIDNLPYIDDVIVLKDILRQMGAKVDLTTDGKMVIDSSNIDTYCANYDIVNRMRASYYLLGVLLGRFGKAEVPFPGAVSYTHLDVYKRQPCCWVPSRPSFSFKSCSSAQTSSCLLPLPAFSSGHLP